MIDRMAVIAANRAATVAVAISDHGPSRRAPSSVDPADHIDARPPVCSAFAGLELGAEGWLGGHRQEDQRGGVLLLIISSARLGGGGT